DRASAGTLPAVPIKVKQSMGYRQLTQTQRYQVHACIRVGMGRRIPKHYAVENLDPPRSAIKNPLIFRAAFPLLATLLVAYFVTAPLGIPIAFVTGTAAVLLMAIAGRWWQAGHGAIVSVSDALRGAPWQIVLFSIGMYLVVYGLGNAGLTNYGAMAIDQANVPAVTQELMVYANVIGNDLGPKFPPIGSLATLLWLHVLAGKGYKIGWGQYMKIGLLITPPVLLATLVALALWLPVLSAG
ncbi:ArsB/NhaD family transporter, partial [Halomonas sp. AOP43-D1-4]|uniref:ArsB/NhaD family transporter n=1 Tax=Halomonas sp. AOP43-D1-4 TaxID=3457658 RepID=UPI004034AA40